MRTATIAAFAFAVVLLPADGFAYKVLLHPNCPGIDANVLWRDYLTAKYPSLPGKITAAAEVQFTLARAVNDPKANGYLDTRRCYNVIFHPGDEVDFPGPHGFPLHIKFPGTFESYSQGAGGATPSRSVEGVSDPSEYEINVSGVSLMFDEGGEVLDHRGRVVGRLVCYFSDDCRGY